MVRYITLVSIFFYTFCIQVNGQESGSIALLDTIEHLPYSTPMSNYLILLKRLKSLSLEEDNKEILALSLAGLSSIYFGQKDYHNFELTLEDFLEVAKDTTTLGVSHYSKALGNYSLLSKIKGDFKKSIEVGLKSIAIEINRQNNHKELGIKYSNISSYYRLLGDYENSLSIAYKAHDEYNKIIFENLDLRRLTLSEAYLDIAFCLIKLKNFKKALMWVNKGLEKLSIHSGERGELFFQLGIDLHLRRAQINLKSNSFQTVHNDLEKVLELQKKTKYRIYYLHELYGEYYTKNLKYKRAIDNYNDALRDAVFVYSDNKEFPAIPRIYKRRANNYIKLDSINQAFNDYQSGLQYFDKNLEDKWSSNPTIKISNSAPVGLDLLTAKATLAKDQFQKTLDTTYLTIAKSTYRAAMNLVDDMRLSYINEGSKYYIVAEAQALYKEYIELLVSAKEYMPKEEWSEEIYNTIQRNKNSVLIERIKEKVAVLSSDLPDEIKDKESKLRSDISFYSRLLSEIDETDSTSLAKKKSYEDELFKAKEDFAIFSNNLKSKYPEYYELSSTPKEYYLLDQVKNVLSTEEAIIEYFETDGGYVIVTIMDSDVQIHVLEDENVSRQLIYYIASLSQSPTQSGVSTEELTTGAEQLYDLFLGKISGLDDIEQLYIIPDGVISKLPFSSLINPKTKAYLLSEKSTSYLVAVDQFMSKEKNPVESNSILGISPNFSTSGDVVDCQCNGSDLEDLTYAMDELTYLQSIYEGSYIKEAQATKASFIENVKDFPVVHLATHACLNESDPMLSQIFFSDGSLTNYDLQNLNINPELVVLAACNTAQGEIQKGEGVISLSRGFFEAGVKSLVSSLWSIDDYSSSEIVKGMYTHLKDGKTKAQSLRQAKLDYLESADKLRSHPYYWAGLVQIGDGSPIINTWNWGMIIGFSALLLVAALFFFRSRK